MDSGGRSPLGRRRGRGVHPRRENSGVLRRHDSSGLLLPMFYPVEEGHLRPHPTPSKNVAAVSQVEQHHLEVLATFPIAWVPISVHGGQENVEEIITCVVRTGLRDGAHHPAEGEC